MSTDCPDEAKHRSCCTPPPTFPDNLWSSFDGTLAWTWTFFLLLLLYSILEHVGGLYNRASLQAKTDLNFKTWDEHICQFISLRGNLSDCVYIYAQSTNTSNTARTAPDDLSELLVQYCEQHKCCVVGVQTVLRTVYIWCRFRRNRPVKFAFPLNLIGGLCHKVYPDVIQFIWLISDGTHLRQIWSGLYNRLNSATYIVKAENLICMSVF